MQQGELLLPVVLLQHDPGLLEEYFARDVAVSASRGEKRLELLKGEDAHAVSHITWHTRGACNR